MTNQTNPPNEQHKQPPHTEGSTVFHLFKPHLIELRDRLARVAISIGIGMLVGLFLVLGPARLVEKIIISFAPMDNPYPPLQAVGTAEVFTSYMLVALVVGIIIAMPMIIYQVVAFIYPALEEDKERRLLSLSLPAITIFFLMGIAFGWFVTVPVAIRFLIGFGNTELIANQPALADFLRTVSLLVLVNGIVFELPVFMYLLARLGLVTARQLRSYRRYALVVVMIIAAVVTPTGDPFNMLLLAIPMYLLYEFGIFVSWLFVPRQPGDKS